MWDLKLNNKLNTLIVDLTSSSVGIAVVGFDKKNLPKLEYFDREWHFFTEKTDSATFITKMISKFSESLARVEKRRDLTSTIDSVHIFLGSPWFYSILDSINFETEKTARFDNKTYDSILTKIKIPENLSEAKATEQTITDISLNGYDTENPFGKKFDKLSASVYLSFVSPNTEAEIKKEIKARIGKKKIYVHTHPLSISYGLKTFLRAENCIFLDVNGEISEVGIISNSGLTSLVSLPFGENEIIREYMKRRGCEKPVAISELETFVSNNANPETMKIAAELVSEFSKKLIDEIDQAVGKSTVLSNNVCLMSHGFGQKFLLQTINSDYASITLFDNQPRDIKYIQGIFAEPLIACSPADLPKISEDSFMQHAINYLNFNLFRVK